MKSTISINAGRCAKCGICVLTCPIGVYLQEETDQLPEVIDSKLCISCGQCVAVCPQDAVDHSAFTPDKVHSFSKSNLPTAEEVTDLLRTRRSVRVFQDKPVEKEIIHKIIEAAQFAPSAHNRQTTEYIVVQDKKVLEAVVKASTVQVNKMLRQLRSPLIRSILPAMMGNQAQAAIGLIPAIEKLVNTLNTGIDGILHSAPLLILFHADTRQLLAEINAQLCLQNAALMAHAQGLGSFYTGYLLSVCQRDKSIGKLVNLPDRHKIYGGLAAGYPKFQYHKWLIRKPAETIWL